MLNNLSKNSISRLQKYPLLKSVVYEFISNNGWSGRPGYLSNLVIYIRELEVYEPEFFGWSEYYEEEFGSWGHNSRYANVLEPLLCYNLNRHVCRLLDYLDSGVAEPSFTPTYNN